MGNTAAVVETLIVVLLAGIVVLLAVLILIKRRRLLQYIENYSELKETDGFARIENNSTQLQPLVKTQCTTVQPSANFWSLPEVSEEKCEIRSASCPVRRNAFSEPDSKTDDARPLKSAETPSLWRKSRKLRRGYSDSCFHVCQLQLMVFYDYYHSKLIVQLICAVNVPSSSGVNHGSYIEVEMSEKKHTTQVQHSFSNPVFDETVEFDVPSEDISSGSVKITLYNMDAFSHGNEVGSLVLYLSELDLSPKKPIPIWRTLVQEHKWKSNSMLSLKEIKDKGQLMVSLKYQSISNKITVVIMKATNLPTISKIFAIDPYVIVMLLLDGRIIQTKKTSMKRRNTCPIWNEVFVFETIAKTPISDYSICLKLKSHNNLSEDLTVGEVDLGCQARGSGKEHWKNMIKSKNQDRAFSHEIH